MGSCPPMIAMLPGAVATVLTTIGIKATAGPFAPAARALAPVARPLLVIATTVLVVGALRCGWLVAVVAAVGGTLLYLSMYVQPSASGGMAGMGMAAHPAVSGAAARAGATGPTNPPLFYAGLAALLGTFVWSAFRRRRRLCRPVLLPARSS